MTNKLLTSIWFWYFSITAILYTIGYTIYTFCTWSLANPFKWLINLPTWDTEGRVLFLILGLFYTVLIITLARALINDVKDEIKQREDQLNTMRMQNKHIGYEN